MGMLERSAVPDIPDRCCIYSVGYSYSHGLYIYARSSDWGRGVHHSRGFSQRHRISLLHVRKRIVTPATSRDIVKPPLFLRGHLSAKTRRGKGSKLSISTEPLDHQQEKGGGAGSLGHILSLLYRLHVYTDITRR